MSSSSKVLAALLPLLFFPVASLAVVVGAAAPLSWSEIIAKVRANNEELQASEKRLQSSSLKISATKANFYPQVSASVSRVQSGNQAMAPAAIEDYGLALNVSENLFAGFQDEAALQIARSNMEIAEANLQAVKAKVSLDLKSAVASLLYSQSYMNLSQNIIERRELNLLLVQLRFDGGRENKGSLLLSKAYLEEAKLDHLEAEQNLAVAQSQLAKVLGESSEALPILADQIPLLEAPPRPTDPEFQNMVQQAPGYRLALDDEKISQSTLLQSKAGFYPSLNLTASVGQTGPSWYPQQDHWSLGANINLPLFNGGRDYYGTQSAAESLKASALTRSSVLRDQLVQLKIAYGNYIRSVQRLRVDEAHVIAADTREKISRQKYNNGLSTFEDWDIIETELITRQKNVIQSRRDRVVTEAAWEQVQGKGVFQ